MSNIDVLAVMEEAEANTYSALSDRIRDARAAVAKLMEPPAVVGVEQVASAIAVEDTGVSWHDVSPRDRTHYVKLARAALAAIAEATGGDA